MTINIKGFTKGWQNAARHEMMNKSALLYMEDCSIDPIGTISARKLLKCPAPFDSFTMGETAGNLAIFHVEGADKQLIYFTSTSGLDRYNSVTGTSTTIATSMQHTIGSAGAKNKKVSFAVLRPILSDYTHVYITNGTTMLCDNGTTDKTWGIDPPTSAPVLSDAGLTGSLTAGDYTYSYTFYDEDTGAESNPSPSATITSSGSDTVRLDNIQTSGNSRVTGRRIYRTESDGGTQYLVKYMADDVVGAYIDFAADTALTTEINTDQGVPPLGSVVATHDDRLWLGGINNYPNRVYFSRASRGDNWPSTYYLETSSTGDKVVNIAQYDGDLFFVLANGIYRLYGSEPDAYVARSTRTTVGAYAKWSVAVGPDGIYFMAKDGFYKFDGYRTASISEGIDSIFNASLDPADTWNKSLDFDLVQNRTRGAFLGNKYYVIVPMKTSGGTTRERVIIYDTADQTWSMHQLNGGWDVAGTIFENTTCGDLAVDSINGVMYITNRFDDFTACQIMENDDDVDEFDSLDPSFVTAAYRISEREEENEYPAVGWIRKYRFDGKGAWDIKFYVDDRLVTTEELENQGADTAYKWHDLPPNTKGRYLYIRAVAEGTARRLTHEFNELEIR